MAMRNIVKIDQEKCNGCGECVTACAEGAIEIIDGKAKLISEIYCDGLGACLGECPQDAITIEQRDAEEFDEEATKSHLEEMEDQQDSSGFVCPGSKAMKLRETSAPGKSEAGDVSSQLAQWPVQLTLVSPQAPYFKGADLLLVADCVPFAMGDFQNKILKGQSIAVGCPKLDNTEFYIEKFTQILNANDLKSLTVVHMEVPCCSGLTYIAQESIARSNVKLSFEDITIDLKGNTCKKEPFKIQS